MIVHRPQFITVWLCVQALHMAVGWDFEGLVRLPGNSDKPHRRSVACVAPGQLHPCRALWPLLVTRRPDPSRRWGRRAHDVGDTQAMRECVARRIEWRGHVGSHATDATRSPCPCARPRAVVRGSPRARQAHTNDRPPCVAGPMSREYHRSTA